MNSKFKIITIVSSIFLIVIIAFITIKGEVFKTEQEILVKAFPANIMDLLNNEEYIDLQYNISNIRFQDVEISGDNFRIGDNIYVRIGTDENGYAVATNIYSILPEDGLFMKGTLESLRNNSFGINYGIDKQFIPKGTDFSGDMEAKIVIDKLGNAKIKSLLIGGKEIK